jgi:hypothetical protein
VRAEILRSVIRFAPFSASRIELEIPESLGSPSESGGSRLTVTKGRLAAGYPGRGGRMQTEPRHDGLVRWVRGSGLSSSLAEVRRVAEPASVGLG